MHHFASLRSPKKVHRLGLINTIEIDETIFRMSSSARANGAAPLPPNVNLTKAKVLKKKHDWSWEDEMLMYDVSHRDFIKKRRLDNKEEIKQVGYVTRLSARTHISV